MNMGTLNHYQPSGISRELPCDFSQVSTGFTGGLRGTFADASFPRVEFHLGNIVGAHVGLNINTGFGIRNGNLDWHVLGFGFKLGWDGIEINTPVVGINVG
jgi:hypothetical protein